MNVFENAQTLPECPRCDAPVIRVIMQRDKPTMYFHERNNQADLIHYDLTTDLVVAEEGLGFEKDSSERYIPITDDPWAGIRRIIEEERKLK